MAALFLIATIAIRVPFLSQPLLGEEGTHAMLLNSNANNVLFDSNDDVNLANCYLIVARLNGNNYVMPPQRNLSSYCFIKQAGSALFPQSLYLNGSFDQKSRLARLSFFSIAFIGIFTFTIAIYLVSLKASLNLAIASYLLVFCTTSSAFFIGATIQPQIDGSLGVALAGISFLIFYLLTQSTFSYPLALPACLAIGVLVASYRNEWSIALLLAIGISWLLVRVIYAKNSSVRYLKYERQSIYGALIFGVFVGWLINAWLYPADSIQGFIFMKKIVGNSYGYTQYWQAFGHYLLPIALIYFLGTLVAIYRRNELVKEDFTLMVCWFWGAIMAIGYFSAKWIGDGFPRYYAGPLLLGVGCLIVQLPHLKVFRQNWCQLICILLLSFIAISQVINILDQSRLNISITVPADSSIEKKKIILDAGQSSSDAVSIVVGHSSLGYYYPKIDFISRDIAPADAQKILNLKISQ